MKFIPLAEPKISKKDSKAVEKQVFSSFVGPGKVTEEFANEIALTSNRKFAVPLNSGSVALSIAAKVLNLKPGDEIAIPCYGVFSVINAFAFCGLKPKLIDINMKTGCMDPKKLEKAITPATKAVCFINFLGSIGKEIEEVARICKQHNIPLIEDGAWSLGRKSQNKIGGSIGDISITSFSVPKIISTGQGGAIMTDCLETKNKIIELSDQGGLNWRKENNINSIGSNLRMCDINSTLGLSQIKELDKRHKLKMKIFRKIQKILDNNLVETSDKNYPFQNIIFVKDKDKTLEMLKKSNIMAADQYNLFNNLNPYKNLGENENFEAGLFWKNHAVYLPFGIGTSLEDMEDMAHRVMDLKIDFIKL